MSWISRVFGLNQKEDTTARQSATSNLADDFKNRFSWKTQEKVRRWVNRFFKDNRDNQARFWQAERIFFEKNGFLLRANDVIWGMLNEDKSLAGLSPIMGMCELLMIEKKYKNCLISSIELTYLQGSGADPLLKEQMDEMNMMHMYEEMPFIGSLCVPYISISATQLGMDIHTIEELFMSEATKHKERLGKYGPETTPREVWETIEKDLLDTLAANPAPPRYRISEPVLSLGT